MICNPTVNFTTTKYGKLSWCLIWMLLAEATIKAAFPQGAGMQYQDDLISPNYLHIMIVVISCTLYLCVYSILYVQGVIIKI